MREMSRGYALPNHGILMWQARDLVAASDGLAKTRELATEYSSNALEALHSFPECEERVALDKLTRDVLTRQK